MQTIDNRLAQAQEMLDDFEAIHNLKTMRAPNEIEYIFNLTYDQLEKLQSIQCAEYSYQLAQYAYYTQKVYNKESATLKWLREQIDNILASDWFNYDGWIKYEIRVKLAAKNNDALAKLVKQAAFVEQKMERMSFLGSRIDKMADTMSRLERAKGYQRER